MNKYIKAMQELNSEAMYPTGYENAIVGIVYQPTIGYLFLVDPRKIIKKLQKDMSKSDAWEYYYYNIKDAYLGVNTPVYLEIVT